MQIQPYLYFDGRCEEALEFYRKAVGATVNFLMRFSESPEPHPPGMMPPGTGNKVMHVTFQIGETILNASDGFCTGKAVFSGVALSLNVASVEQADRCFAALSEGGEVRMPLAETFFAHRFGMLTDRFGLQWIVISPKAM